MESPAPLTLSSAGAVDRGLPRTAALVLAGTGVLGGVLYLLVGFVTQLPGPGDSWTDWVKWSQSHPQAAEGEVGLWALTLLVLLCFGIYLVEVTSGSRGWARWLWRAAFVALGVRASMEFVAATILAIPAVNSGHEFNSSVADFGSHLNAVSLLPHAIFLATLGGAMLITRSVPRWVGRLTLGVGCLPLLAPVLAILSSANLLNLLGPIPLVYGALWYLSLPLWPLITGGTLVVWSARERGH